MTGHSQTVAVDGVKQAKPRRAGSLAFVVKEGNKPKQLYEVAFVLINLDRLKVSLRSDLGHIFTPLIKDGGFSTLLVMHSLFLFQSLRRSRDSKRTDIAHPSKINTEQ